MRQKGIDNHGHQDFVLGRDSAFQIGIVIDVVKALDQEVVGLLDVGIQAGAGFEEAARQAEAGGKGSDGFFCGAAIELKDGRIVTGKNSPLMHAASSLVLNAVKLLANIPETIHLLPTNVTRSLSHFKTDVLKGKVTSLDLEETLIALSISALMNPAAEAAIERLKEQAANVE